MDFVWSGSLSITVILYIESFTSRLLVLLWSRLIPLENFILGLHCRQRSTSVTCWVHLQNGRTWSRHVCYCCLGCAYEMRNTKNKYWWIYAQWCCSLLNWLSLEKKNYTIDIFANEIVIERECLQNLHKNVCSDTGCYLESLPGHPQFSLVSFKIRVKKFHLLVKDKNWYHQSKNKQTNKNQNNKTNNVMKNQRVKAMVKIINS